MSEQVLHIEIDVSFADDQIRGQVRDSARAPKPFSGWLGLIGALDEMLESVHQGEKAAPQRAGAQERSE